MKVSVIHRAFEESSRLVAFVEAPDNMSRMDALEYAYRRTNNIMGSWSREETFFFNGEKVINEDYSDDVIVMADLPVNKRTGEVMGLRSTSMGDRMIIGNTVYRVAMCGFEIENEEAVA